MAIERKQSVLWGLIPLRTEEVSAGHGNGFEKTWHDANGIGRWRYFDIEVVSPDTLRIFDARNEYGAYRDETLSGEEINKNGVCIPPSCLGWLVGYNDAYYWVPSNSGVPS